MAGDQIEHPDPTPAVHMYCKTPSVWRQCFGEKPSVVCNSFIKCHGFT